MCQQVKLLIIRKLKEVESLEMAVTGHSVFGIGHLPSCPFSYGRGNISSAVLLYCEYRARENSLSNQQEKADRQKLTAYHATDRS